MAEPDALGRLVGFGRELRRRGLPVGTGRILTFCRATVALSPLDRERLYWAGRASLVGRKEDFEAFDSAFEEYFRGIGVAESVMDLRLPREAVGAPVELPEDLEVEVSETAAEWHRVEVFGKAAQVARDYLTKGRSVYLEGSVRYDEWTDKDGNKRNATKIRISGPNSRLVLLGGRGEGGPRGGPAEPSGEGQATETFQPSDDDVPF